MPPSGQVAVSLEPLEAHEVRTSRTIGTPESVASSRKRPIIYMCNSVPSYFFIALAILAVLETLSIVGSYYYIQGQASANRDAALNIARVSGRAMERLIDDQKAPIHEMVDYIKTMKGHYPSIKKGFLELAGLIAESWEFYQIELVPKGYISDMYLPWQNLTGDALEQWKINNLDLYLNILWPNSKRPNYWGPLDADLATINTNGSIYLTGPWIGEGVLSKGAFVSRISIFLPDYGNWSLPPETLESICPPSFCKLPDNRTLWGFVVCIWPYSTIAQGLSAVKGAGLRYHLRSNYVQAYSNYPIVLDSNYALTAGDQSECTLIDVFQWLGWKLCVSQDGGWNPNWGPALYAGVTVLSVLISVLVCFVLRSRASAVDFLSKQVTWNKELETEKEKLQTMMVRQYEIIECFTLKKNSQNTAGIEDKIKAARDQLTASGVTQMAEQDKIVLFNLLGQGSFGAVFLGEWRGTKVAVKRIILPPAMSISNRAEKMAIMEVAISSSMSHPHLVQTYTYRVKPIENKPDDLNGCIVVMGGGDGSTIVPTNVNGGSSIISNNSSQDSNSVTSYELLLVLEYCDKGSLRSLLDVRGLEDENGRLNYPAALELCLDIAKAMIHLHRNNIMHLDLKAANVLLKTGSSGDNSFIAKVMDFGLSVSLDVETHVSSLVAGTTSHMSPEILMEGKQTKAADVYAFGITLWEIFTGNKAYKGIPQMVLGHKIVFEHLRPAFPVNTPANLKLLAEKCWHPDPKQRPNFDVVLKELREMREEIDGGTMPLRKIDFVANPTSSSVASQEPVLAVAQFAPKPQNENDGGNSIVADSMAAGYKVSKQA